MTIYLGSAEHIVYIADISVINSIISEDEWNQVVHGKPFFNHYFRREILKYNDYCVPLIGNSWNSFFQWAWWKNL